MAAVPFCCIVRTSGAVARTTTASASQANADPEAGRGNPIQRPTRLRTMVGSAWPLRRQLLILYRRRRHSFLHLRTHSLDPAGVAAAGLRRCDGFRHRHQCAPNGVRRALLYRRSGWRHRGVSGGLAGAWLHLPLAVDTVERCRNRRRTDALRLAGLSFASEVARPRCRVSPRRSCVNLAPTSGRRRQQANRFHKDTLAKVSPFLQPSQCTRLNIIN